MSAAVPLGEANPFWARRAGMADMDVGVEWAVHSAGVLVIAEGRILMLLEPRLRDLVAGRCIDDNWPVDDVEAYLHDAVAALQATGLLDGFGLILPTREQLREPLPIKLEIPTVMDDAHVLDAILYWED